MDEQAIHEIEARKRGHVGSYISGLLFGGMVGAVAALLYAPRAGNETRAILREKGMEIKENVAESVDVTRARASLAISEMRYRAEELVDMGKERAIELQQLGRDAIEEGKARVEKAVEAAKEPAGHLGSDRPDEPTESSGMQSQV